MTKPLVKRPVSIYRRSEWRQKPRNPGDWGTKWYIVQPGDSLAKIAAKSEIAGLTWKDLTFFNWGTRNPKEVNWYLKHHCGCTRLTEKGNYRFDVKRYREQSTPVLVKRIWIPIPEETASPSKPVAGPRRKTHVINTQVCPLEKGGEIQCYYDGDSPPTCLGPRNTSQIDVELGKSLSKLESLAAALLSGEAVDLVLTRGTVRNSRLPHNWRPPSAWTKLKESDPDPDPRTKWYGISPNVIRESIWIDIIGGEHKGGVDKKTKGRESKDFDSYTLPEEGDPEWTTLENKILAQPQELHEAAQYIRVLQDSKRIKRITIRGYADKRGRLQENLELSVRRAKWTKQTLMDKFGLLSGVPVQIVGCGEFHAQNSPRNSLDDRVVTIEIKKAASQDQTKSDEGKEGPVWDDGDTYRDKEIARWEYIDEFFEYAYKSDLDARSRVPKSDRHDITPRDFHSGLNYWYMTGKFDRHRKFSECRSGAKNGLDLHRAANQSEAEEIRKNALDAIELLENIFDLSKLKVWLEDKLGDELDQPKWKKLKEWIEQEEDEEWVNATGREEQDAWFRMLKRTVQDWETRLGGSQFPSFDKSHTWGVAGYENPEHIVHMFGDTKRAREDTDSFYSITRPHDPVVIPASLDQMHRLPFLKDAIMEIVSKKMVLTVPPLIIRFNTARPGPDAVR